MQKILISLSMNAYIVNILRKNNDENSGNIGTRTNRVE